MCLDCQELYAQVADLHAQLAAYTQSWTTGDERGTVELAQLRAACTQARQALQQHRKQHQADEPLASGEASFFVESGASGAR